MKRILCLVVCLVIAVLQAAGQYTRTQIFDLAQNHVKQFLGPVLATCAHMTEGIRYSYKGKDGKLEYKDLSVDDVVQGKVERIYVFYRFEYAYPEYRDTIISSNFNLEFDQNLQIVRKPDLGFIPDYVWTAKKDEFIGWDKAKEIALANGLPAEIPEGKQTMTTLHHSKKTQQFAYVIDLATEPYVSFVEHEVWFINAINGELLHHEIGEKAMDLFLSMMQ